MEKTHREEPEKPRLPDGTVLKIDGEYHLVSAYGRTWTGTGFIGADEVYRLYKSGKAKIVYPAEWSERGVNGAGATAPSTDL